MMKLLVIIGSILAVYAEQKFYRVPIKHRDLSFREDVMLDAESKYAIVTIEDANRIPGYQNSINLHDLETGYTAVKDVTTGVCHIYHSRHTVDQLQTAVANILEENGRHEMKDYLWDCSQAPIKNEEIELIAGKRIAEFCYDYQAKIVVRQEVSPFLRHKRAVAALRYGCVLCFGGCNGSRKEKEKKKKE